MVDNSKAGNGTVIEEALSLLGEIDGNYRRQLKQILDAEVAALLEALTMFHENSGKRLKSCAREVMRSS
jgi:hypothetical protein